MTKKIKVILICQENEFDKLHIKKINKYAEVIWVNNEKTDLLALPNLSDNDQKILAISPVPLDWQIPSYVYQNLNNVKAICLATTGFDFVDLTKTNDLNITVTNVPYYSTNAVAEYALFMLFSLLKKVPYQIKSNFKSEFTDYNIMDQLNNKVVGIIGLGHIGEKIANLLNNLDLKIIYWSKNSRNSKYKYVTLVKLLKTSDIVFPTFSLNDQSQKILTKKNLSLMKKSAYLVNIVGENAIDTQFLINQTENKKLQGLAFESETIKMKDYKENVFITAPMAWYTRQSLANNIDIWTDTIISCIKHKPINIVSQI